jgi:hypothetical protein
VLRFGFSFPTLSLQQEPGMPNPQRNIPDVNHSSSQSAKGYIIDRLIDKPGQTYISLAYGRPAHVTPSTIQTACYTLTTAGVLTKEGHGDTAIFRVAQDGLGKLSPNFDGKGRPGAGGAGEERDGSTHTKGPAGVSRLPVEHRAPLTPVKGAPIDLGDRAIKRTGHLGAVPPKQPDPEVKAAIEAQYTGPVVGILVGGKLRHYPVSIAKEMYKQLKEFFD